MDNAKDNINRVQEIVQQKVGDALAEERKQMKRLEEENERLLQREAILSDTNETLKREKDSQMD